MQIEAREMKILKILLIFLLAVLYAINVFSTRDPDLGWHLRAGEIVEQTGQVPHEEPWLYTMPNHKWIDHEWLVDSVFWYFWKSDLWYVTQIIFLLLSLLPFVWWIKKISFPLELYFAALGGYMFISISGTRPQILSVAIFFLVAHLFYQRFILDRQKKYFWLLPFIFILWSNLHAGFMAGLLLFGLYLVYPFFVAVYKKNKYIHLKTHYNLYVILLLSIITTFFTPYGTSLWREIWDSSTFSQLSKISEWASSFASWPILFPLFISPLLILVLTFYRKIHPTLLITTGFFAIESILHTRMLPFLLFAALPLIHICASEFNALINTQKTIRRFETYFYAVLFSSIIIAMSLSLYSYILHPFSRPSFLEGEVLKSLQSRVQGNVFNDYNLGGSLIMGSPTSHFFIDGRAPHWKNDAGDSPFADYLNIIHDGEGLKNIFLKHDVSIVVLSSYFDNAEFRRSLNERMGFFPPPLRAYISGLIPLQDSAFYTALRANNWCEVYRNDTFLVLVSPEQSLCLRYPQ
ncbi:MAG: hypothetical protein UY04_C0011G0027 [Parcubacteria group bacterium GW2011_GWA2_47_7]|nr:MAG: hypothetical protein UY04_C0011G0027 [Parcubacteria group bacterium GW2011_GWA2_47_7]